MTTSESEPTESEIAPPTVLDSRKAKVVALLLAAAPSAALLFFSLYSGDLIDAPAYGGWPFVIAYLLALAVVPLYFAFKIWLRPTLKNLRRVPFIAAFCCYLVSLHILWLLFPQEQGLLAHVGILLSLLLTLGAYFLVKNAMVLWFKTPELAHSGLKTGRRTTLWRFYCFFLWVFLNTIGDDLLKHFYSTGSQDYPPEVPFLIQLVVFVICVYVAMYVYGIGRRTLGLQPD